MVPVTLHDVLREYGLDGARVSRLDGGAINDVWRIDTAGEAFALKHYSKAEMTPQRLRLILAAEGAARGHGIIVPENVPTDAGERYVEADGLWVLTRFVEGRTLRVGEVPEAAARSMGRTLARLHEALSTLPPGEPWILPAHDWIESHLRELLATGNRLRELDPLDERACRLLERKLVLLTKLPPEPPRIEPHWVHRDFTVRNLLFDEHDEVSAVLDFDELRYTDRRYELMRCLDHGFPAWSREAFALFEEYAAATGLTSQQARDCAYLHCYVTSFATWPMRARYAQDEEYRDEWDEFIRLPEHPWDNDPGELAEGLVALVDSRRR